MSRAIEELHVYAQSLRRSGIRFVAEFQRHCEENGSWVDFDASPVSSDVTSLWEQAVASFSVEQQSKDPRGKACCEFMTTPSVWKKVWHTVNWQPETRPLPQKHDSSLLILKNDSVGSACLCIPNLVWYIYGKECAWGAINFVVPPDQSAEDAGLYEVIMELARLTLQNAALIAS